MMANESASDLYYPDGSVRLPAALEAWLDSVMEGDKGDDPDERLSWDQVRNVVDVVLWQLIHQAADPDDCNEDARRALLDALDATPIEDVNDAIDCTVQIWRSRAAEAYRQGREQESYDQEQPRLMVHPNPCITGWGPGCPDTYTGGHMCHRDAGHDGRCHCSCGSRHRRMS